LRLRVAPVNTLVGCLAWSGRAFPIYASAGGPTCRLASKGALGIRWRHPRRGASLILVSARWAISALLVSILGVGVLTGITYRAAM